MGYSEPVRKGIYSMQKVGRFKYPLNNNPLHLKNNVNYHFDNNNQTFRVIAKHFDSRIFGRRISRKRKLSYLSLRLLYRVNCNPGVV